MVLLRIGLVVAAIAATIVSLQSVQRDSSMSSEVAPAHAAPGLVVAAQNGNGGNGNGGTVVVVASGSTGGVGTCAPAGQSSSVASPDGRVVVRVFPSMTQDVRITVQMPIDSASVPGTPRPAVGGLLFRVAAEPCNGGPGYGTLPAEVNLGAAYTDADVSGINESELVIARLDLTDNQWEPVAKLATDPSANYVSATIADTGTYAVYQR